MQPSDFKKWRKSIGLSQKEAATALGLKRRMIQYYEKGERDGEAVKIPLTVRLACHALSEGVLDYKGPHRKVKKGDIKDAVRDPKSKHRKKDKDKAN